jgi:hypothetical protein
LRDVNDITVIFGVMHYHDFVGHVFTSRYILPYAGRRQRPEKRLAEFDRASGELWLGLQDQYDLYRAWEKSRDVLKGIKPLREKAKVR